MKRLSQRKESILERNLVWIFASPRSGTSWLANQLLSHDSYTMDEPCLGEHLCAPVIKPEGVKRTIDRQRNRSFRKQHYFFSEKYEAAWGPFLKKMILNRVYAQFPDISKRIIIKEPHGSLGADILSSCLPGSRIILLFRDGRDVVDSLVDGRSEGGWIVKKEDSPLTSQQERLKFIETCAKRWVAIMEILQRVRTAHNKERVTSVRYEILRRNTGEILQRLYDFIGKDVGKETVRTLVERFSFERIPEEDRGRGKSRRFADPGKWREHFSTMEASVMQEIMGDTLKTLGYS